MDDADGRWFTFNVKPTDLLILEKKTVPGHLSAMECLDVPVTFTSVLSDLEDAGEVTRPNNLGTNMKLLVHGHDMHSHHLSYRGLEVLRYGNHLMADST